MKHTFESVKNVRVLKREQEASKNNADVRPDQSFGKRENGQNEHTDKALKQVTEGHRRERKPYCRIRPVNRVITGCGDIREASTTHRPIYPITFVCVTSKCSNYELRGYRYFV